MNHQKLKPFILTTLVLLVLTLAMCSDQKQLPEGWRLPHKSEITDIPPVKDLKDAPNGNDYIFMEADFNGDDIIDTARLIVNDKEDKTGLLVSLSKEDSFTPLLVVEVDGKFWVNAIALHIVESGTYITPCGEGLWECEANDPKEITVKHQAIEWYNFDGGVVYIIWDEATQSFQEYVMGD